MSSEMIARVADVLSRTLPTESFATSTPEECARAILTAMREPTEAMLGDGMDTLLDPQAECGSATVWRAMIDAALEEEGATDGIDLLDNPVRVLKAIWQRQGWEVDPASAAELDAMERHLDEPGDRSAAPGGFRPPGTP